MALKPGAEGGSSIRGRSFAVMAKDIMEGYVSLNPLILKKFDATSYKELHQQLYRLQTKTRTEGVSLTNQEALRNRNQRLQRLHQALSVIENQARLQRIILV
jgi:flagellar motor component MotA